MCSASGSTAAWTAFAWMHCARSSRTISFATIRSIPPTAPITIRIIASCICTPPIALMRQVSDSYDDRLLIGELYLPIERLVRYYGENGRGVHLPFNFHL